YREHKDSLILKFHIHRDDVIARITALLPALRAQGLQGQWSVDIMKNGEDFYLIDMALMCESALSELLAVTDEYATVKPSIINTFANQLLIDYIEHNNSFDQHYPTDMYSNRTASAIS